MRKISSLIGLMIRILFIVHIIIWKNVVSICPCHFKLNLFSMNIWWKFLKLMNKFLAKDIFVYNIKKHERNFGWLACDIWKVYMPSSSQVNIFRRFECSKFLCSTFAFHWPTKHNLPMATNYLSFIETSHVLLYAIIQKYHLLSIFYRNSYINCNLE